MPVKKNSEEFGTRYRFYVARDELFIDMNLYQFGWEHCAPLHLFGPAKRNHYLFHFVISGKGKLETNGQTYSLIGGQGFLLCPDQISTYYADPNDPWYYAWIEFDGFRARECMLLAGLSENNPVYIPMDANARTVQDYLLEIVDNADQAPIRLIGKTMVLIDEIVQTSCSKISTGNRKIREFYMKEAITFIESNYQRDISIDDIASASGLNRNYFSKLFKERFGKTPQDFLIEYRMNKAAELLSQSSLPVAKISEAVGYENPFNFSRTFKNHFGIPPREYRSNKFIR